MENNNNENNSMGQNITTNTGLNVHVISNPNTEFVREVKVPDEYRPITPWGYVKYNILFIIPIFGWIYCITCCFNNVNLNRRNYARSIFCTMFLAILLILFVLAVLFMLKRKI